MNTKHEKKKSPRNQIKRINAYEVYGAIFRFKKDAARYKFEMDPIKVGDHVRPRYNINKSPVGYGEVIETMTIEEYTKRMNNYEENWMRDVYGISGMAGRIIKIKEQFINDRLSCYPEFDLYRTK